MEKTIDNNEDVAKEPKILKAEVESIIKTLSQSW